MRAEIDGLGGEVISALKFMDNIGPDQEGKDWRGAPSKGSSM